MTEDITEIENTDAEEINQHWFIDLDWYQPGNRSFPTLAHACLCPECRERLAGEDSADKLLAAAKYCCSKAPDFVTGKQPIWESIFRLFLANGNQSLTLEELGKQLNDQRSGDSYRTSVELLHRLLSSDSYYGLRPIPEPPEAGKSTK